MFFKSDEQHIRTLAWDAKGNLIAGSDGSGLVYRISPQGKGYVLFEAPRREITSVAVGTDGTIYAASVGDKSHNPLPPLPVQGIGVDHDHDCAAGLAAGGEREHVGSGRNRNLRAERRAGAAQAVVEQGRDRVCAGGAADGLLALSGNRGHIFRIQANGDYADVAHLEAQQGLCLARGTRRRSC